MKSFTPFLFLLFTFCATAQEYPYFSPGIEFNPAIDWVKAQSNANSGTSFSVNNGSAKVGFAVGIMGDYIIKHNYGVSVELRLSEFSASFVTLPDLNETITSTVNYQFVELPVCLKMFTDQFGYTRIYAKVGLTPSVLTSARTDVTDNGGAGGSSITVKNQNIYSHTTPLDFSVFAGLGMEYNISGTTNLIVGLSYHYGFIDMTKEKDISLMTRYVALDLGIKF